MKGLGDMKNETGKEPWRLFPAFVYFHIFKSDKMDKVISAAFPPVASVL